MGETKVLYFDWHRDGMIMGAGHGDWGYVVWGVFQFSLCF